MQCLLIHEKQKQLLNFDPGAYKKDREKALVDFAALVKKKFHLKDIKIYKIENEQSTDRDDAVEDSDDLLDELYDKIDTDASTAYFLIDGTPMAPAKNETKYKASVNLAKCGWDNNLSMSISQCKFSDEEGWNNLWQDLCDDIGNELKNDKWEEKHELVGIKANAVIKKLSQFINVFKNIKDVENGIVQFSVQVKLLLCFA